MTVTTPQAPIAARTRMVDAALSLLLGPAAGAEPWAAADNGGTQTARRRATRADARGAEAIGIRAVAEAAGVTHAAPLHHFPDRISLLAAVAAEGQRRLAASLDAARQEAAGRGARALLGNVVRAHALWAARNAGLWDVMCNQQLTDEVTAVWRARHEGRSALDALAASSAQALRSPTARALARRAEAFDELVNAKVRVFEAYDAAVYGCGAHELELTRLPGGDRRPLVHALTTVADGLSLQFVGERNVDADVLAAHVNATLDLLLAGVVRGGTATTTGN